MTTFSRGDIVLLKLVFADEKGVKRRPGLIVSTETYHQGRREVILAAITSNDSRLLVGDYRIEAWRESGLLSPSIVTGIVRTIKQEMIADRMGSLPASELDSVQDRLRAILGLAAMADTNVAEASR
jgi:mRNA interferase MazF